MEERTWKGNKFEGKKIWERTSSDIVKRNNWGIETVAEEKIRKWMRKEIVSST